MKNRNVKGGNGRRFFMVLLLFLLLFLFPGNSSSQFRFDVPTANTAIGNPVPFPLIEKIAIQKCKKKWGKGALGEPIPLCDLEGNLTAYMFPFHIGADRFPSHEEIFTRIKEGRELHEHIKNQQIDKAREKYQGLKQSSKEAPKTLSPEIIRALSDPQVVTIEGVRPDGSRPRSFEVAEIREMEKFAMKKAAGGDEFGTIVVSATYGRVPVPVYYHGLPVYFTRQDLARERAEKAIGPDASLRRIYFLGMRGKIFEFTNQRSKVFLHAFTLEVKDDEIAELRSNRLQAQQLSSTEMEGRRAKIREKLAKDWETMHAEIGEK
jgi:hypothetical protein